MRLKTIIVGTIIFTTSIVFGILVKHLFTFCRICHRCIKDISEFEIHVFEFVVLFAYRSLNTPQKNKESLQPTKYKSNKRIVNERQLETWTLSQFQSQMKSYIKSKDYILNWISWGKMFNGKNLKFALKTKSFSVMLFISPLLYVS